MRPTSSTFGSCAADSDFLWFVLGFSAFFSQSPGCYGAVDSPIRTVGCGECNEPQHVRCLLWRLRWGSQAHHQSAHRVAGVCIVNPDGSRGWTTTVMQDNYDLWQAKQQVNLDEVEKLELLDL